MPSKFTIHGLTPLGFVNCLSFFAFLCPFFAIQKTRSGKIKGYVQKTRSGKIKGYEMSFEFD